MNKWIGMGRLTKDPDIRYAGETAVARFTLAIDRRYNKEEQKADFISCVAFNKKAEFAERYLHQGTKIAVEGRIQTESYTNKDGQKVYTTDIIVEELEFAESKGAGEKPAEEPSAPAPNNGFMKIPDGIANDLPFK